MRKMTGLLAAMVVAMVAAGCTTTPATEERRENLMQASQTAMDEMRQADPSLDGFLKNAYGYAFFPTVGKGGLIAGGAYGHGVVYEQGNFIGYSDISQLTVGAQAGGQSFSELIAFENKAALDRFTAGKFTFAANASAVALKTGAGATAKYNNGVAIFVEPVAGLMVEAAVGGQQFTFNRANRPANEPNMKVEGSMNDHSNMNGTMNTNNGVNASGSIDVDRNGARVTGNTDTK